MSRPETDYIELNLCKSNATGVGKNEQVSLERVDDTLVVVSGRVNRRVGKQCMTTDVYTMTEPYHFHMQRDRAGKIFETDYERDAANIDELYESMFQWYIKKGYLVTKTEKLENLKYQKTKNQFKPLEDKDVQAIIDYLRTFQDQYMEENYTITLDNISQEMISQAQEFLEDLYQRRNNMSLANLNMELHKYYVMIPRLIPNLRKYDIHKKADIDQRFSDEQEKLDFLVELKNSPDIINNDQNQQTILEALQLQWRDVNIDEMLHLKDLMQGSRNRYIRAWRIENERTRRYMNNYCKKKNLTEENGGIMELFHGSKTENFFSIIKNGLWLCPEQNGISICGKAFGHGIYFANLAQKSIGYTSTYNSYWAHGDQSKGYLAVFEVATGEIYDIYREGKGVPDNYADLQRLHPNADCTFAYSRKSCENSYLVNDEIIVYTDGSVQEGSLKPESERFSQCTIKYLIEFDAAAM